MSDKLKATLEALVGAQGKDKLTGLNERDGKHYHCAESTVMMINDKHPLPGFGLDTMRIMSCTGSGISLSGCACGAVVGIGTALGLVYGTDGTETAEEFSKKRNPMMMMVRGIVNEFREKFGAVNCVDLIGLDFSVDDDGLENWLDVYIEREKLDVNCHSYIDWAAERVLAQLKT
jgi:C_GCAxxG_C_C family probable redox protein